jgi:glycosyltransferase involved in cell wall biosynthesis
MVPGPMPDSLAPEAETPTAEPWIVIAAYNEGGRLGETLRGLVGRYRHIVVVDDGSVDDTSAIALKHPTHVLRHVINLGQGAALQTGIDFALRNGAPVVVTFDADGQHDPADVAVLLKPILEGQADVVLGSRFLGRTIGLTWARWLVLKVGVLFTLVFSNIRVTDAHNGLRALTRHAASHVRITHNGMAHASEILDKIREFNLRFCEVPVTIRYTDETRAKGQNSWNALKIVSQLLLGRMVR